MAEALTVAEAAAEYSVSPKVITAAITNGALAAKHVGLGEQRRHVRIPAANLRAWFEALPDA